MGSIINIVKMFVLLLKYDKKGLRENLIYFLLYAFNKQIELSEIIKLKQYALSQQTVKTNWFILE